MYRCGGQPKLHHGPKRPSRGVYSILGGRSQILHVSKSHFTLDTFQIGTYIHFWHLYHFTATHVMKRSSIFPSDFASLRAQRGFARLCEALRDEARFCEALRFLRVDLTSHDGSCSARNARRKHGERRRQRAQVGRRRFLARAWSPAARPRRIRQRWRRRRRCTSRASATSCGSPRRKCRKSATPAQCCSWPYC